MFQYDEPVFMFKYIFFYSFDKLSSFQIKQIEWDDNEGVCNEKHALYLNHFGNLFRNKMEELINLNNSSSVKYNPIIEEILIHSRFAKKLVDRFVERNDILKLVISFAIY